ncbi:hypothetical protein AVDCRST_MAG81-4877 [uncultured Synechococcales cyanobacterium]|uniref:Uncharacterized protein n=1 Tax=uncultured Synechococcales cyanobacterium TaxID=1936017 RepID=A0A6J4VUR8_9CYAN|nr:hypothetical protein AVDCRST_MAG81-4877 [uncultured Synechococcales cyanobacterium]
MWFKQLELPVLTYGSLCDTVHILAGILFQSAGPATLAH